MSTASIKGFNPERIKIAWFGVTQFNLWNDGDDNQPLIEAASTTATIGANLKYNPKVNAAIVILGVDLSGLDAAGKPTGTNAHIRLRFDMTVEDLDEFLVTTPDGTKAMNHQIAATLMAICYSTARGIVFERTMGTLLRGTVLAVIDPKELLPKPGASGEVTAYPERAQGRPPAAQDNL